LKFGIQEAWTAGHSYMKSLLGSVAAGLIIATGSMVGDYQTAATAAVDTEWARTVEAATKEGKVSVFLDQR
jgi:hypothetical protein